MLRSETARELLHSLPVEVEFAGFRGNTLSLARAGWDLSMRQSLDPRWGEPSLQLAMRHEGAKLYALSNEVRLDYGRMMGSLSDAMRYAEFLAQICFFIEVVAPEIRFAHRAVRTYGVSFAESFQAIDPFPQERIEEHSIREFKFFKVANPTIKDIVVSPDQVPELLELVLKAQDPTMRDVRARERSRANLEAMRRMENGFSTKPAHQVQAQIITLAS